MLITFSFKRKILMNITKVVFDSFLIVYTSEEVDSKDRGIDRK